MHFRQRNRSRSDQARVSLVMPFRPMGRDERLTTRPRREGVLSGPTEDHEHAVASVFLHGWLGDP